MTEARAWFFIVIAGLLEVTWAVGTAILGVLLLGESRSLVRLLCIGLIIAGIIGVRVTK